MKAIKKKYIVDENSKRVAVQIGIDDFNKIEQIMEDYALGKLIDENDSSKNLALEDVKDEYFNLSEK